MDRHSVYFKLYSTHKALICLFLFAVVTLLPLSNAQANPAFARQYNVSCALCHAAFPRLNNFGREFLDNNIRMDGWEKAIGTDTGDARLVLPKFPQLAMRAQAFAQVRQNDARDDQGNVTFNSNYDFQSPYLIKLMSGAPLSENISYYFYGILAEKGANGSVIVEDAWFRHSNLFGAKVGMMLGQFQISDFMYGRETRLTVQDFMVYRMAGITYDRGITLDRALGPLTISMALTNGNGIEERASLNSAGFNRPDATFDRDSRKNAVVHLGLKLGDINAGMLYLDGNHEDAARTKMTDKRVYGVNLAYSRNDRWFLFSQWVWNEWADFTTTGKTARWQGGFVGADFVPNEYWAFSMLYNTVSAGDLKDAPVYGGLRMNTLTATASYYF
ncbi:MAG: hypothetical protein OEW08_15360, partial [Gammaproteobacteria bacterium]|nr:hypothetical protein [Gammaproteobacteria bacterium]